MKEGVWEWWYGYTLQLNTAVQPEAVASTAGPAATAARGNGDEAGNENRPRQPSSAGSAAEAPPAAKGKRWRLLPLPEGQQRALPARGKVTLLYGGHTCEAALSLPASETR